MMARVIQSPKFLSSATFADRVELSHFLAMGLHHRRPTSEATPDFPLVLGRAGLHAFVMFIAPDPVQFRRGSFSRARGRSSPATQDRQRGGDSRGLGWRRPIHPVSGPPKAVEGRSRKDTETRPKTERVEKARVVALARQVAVRWDTLA